MRCFPNPAGAAHGTGNVETVLGLAGLGCWGMTLLGIEVKCSTQAGAVDIHRDILRLEYTNAK